MTLAIERPADADNQKVEALYREDRDRLLRIAMRHAPTRDAGEDAVQDAFVKLIETGDEVRVPAAFVTSQAKGRAMQETTHRGRQQPAGDTIDRLADLSVPGGSGIAACMGDPTAAAKVTEALATLTDRQRQMVQMHCLNSVPVSQVADELGVTKHTVYDTIRTALDRLSKLGVTLDDEPEPQPVVAPAPATNGFGAVPVEALVATLDREFPGRWVGVDAAEKTLRKAHGSCSTNRAIAAQKAHNAPYAKPASAMRGPVRAGPGAKADDSDLIKQARALVERSGVPLSQTAIQNAFKIGAIRARRIATALDAPADASTDVPVPVVASKPRGGSAVAEVWLMGAKPPISCLLVHADESTSSRDLAAVSMPGAQREVTGWLVGDGYRPDGPWVDVDPAGPEAMRKFTGGAR